MIIPPSQPTPPKAVIFRCAFDEEAKDEVLDEEEFNFADAREIKIGNIESKCRVFHILRSAVGKRVSIGEYRES